MSISNKQLRLILRYTHLAASILIILFVYSPLGDVPAFELLVQIALIPVAVLTGIWIWQQARVRRLLARFLTGPRKEMRR
jgi:thiosulfate reductase cytochrome b subunit